MIERILSRELAAARATPYVVTVTLSREDWENFAAFRDAWNAYRAQRGLPALTTQATITKALQGAAAWLAGKDNT